VSGYNFGANACKTMFALVFDCLFLLFALIIQTSFINFSSCYADADVCDFQAAAAGDADGVQKGMGNWTWDFSTNNCIDLSGTNNFVFQNNENMRVG
jgi:hypothetical protein